MIALLGMSFVAATAPLVLPGLDPQVYEKTRARIPHVERDVAALDVAALSSILRGETSVVFSVDKTRRAKEEAALIDGAVGRLASFGDEAVAPLMSLLSPPSWTQQAGHLRARVVRALGETGAASVVAQLAVLADDADGAVAAAARAGLGAHRSDAAVDALLALLRTEKPVLQASTLRALQAATSMWAWEAAGQKAHGQALLARVEAELHQAKITDDNAAFVRVWLAHNRR
jgi:hypothetical protein